MTHTPVTSLRKAWEIQWGELTLEGELGKGGNGVVYGAKWRDMTVAVKTVDGVLCDFSLNSELDKEVSMLQMVRHPNIVLFFGAGTVDGRTPFLVTELVELGDLHKYLTTHTVGWDRKLQFALDTAEGMAHLHSLGKIHRDLKSGNLLVSASLRVKVADFGTASFMASSSRLAERVSETELDSDDCNSVNIGHHTKGVGTPMWMAPELLEGRVSYGPRVDVYSFGIVMWEIASQQLPWADLNLSNFMMNKLLQTILSGQRPPVDSAWPVAYSRLMEICWATDSGMRPSFDNARSVLKDLSRRGSAALRL